jgi:hypothetical protein
MTYVHGKTLKEITSPDGTRRVDIVARDDGMFQFFEQIAQPEGWHPGKVGGLFATAEATERAARAAFDL